MTTLHDQPNGRLTASLPPDTQREVRLVRIEESQKAIRADVQDLKADFNTMRSDIFEMLRADRKSRELCLSTFEAVVKPIATPKVAIAALAVIGVLVVGMLGMNAQYGDLVVGAAEQLIDDMGDDPPAAEQGD